MNPDNKHSIVMICTSLQSEIKYCKIIGFENNLHNNIIFYQQMKTLLHLHVNYVINRENVLDASCNGTDNLFSNSIEHITINFMYLAFKKIASEH